VIVPGSTMSDASNNPSRRRLLRLGGALVGAPLLGSWLAGCEGRAAAPAATPAAAALPEADASFIALSRTLTGYDAPDALLARRLQAELLQDDPDLLRHVALIARRLASAPATAAAFADAPALHALFGQLLSGWYLGVVGPASAPRCIAFEDIVSYRVVAGSVQPPSYCSGVPDFWVSDPTS
jgi:hypothetical protein